jgi:hypothetical protein
MKNSLLIPIFLSAVLSMLPSAPVVAQVNLDSITKGASDLMKSGEGSIDLPSSLTSSFQDLIGSFDMSQTGALKHANSALSALGQGEDGNALNLLNKVQKAGLKPDQMELLKDVKLGVDQYVLNRQFGGIPEFKGPMKKVTQSLKSGNPNTISKELKNLMKSTSPSKEQKALLNTMLKQYKNWW